MRIYTLSSPFMGLSPKDKPTLYSQGGKPTGLKFSGQTSSHTELLAKSVSQVVGSETPRAKQAIEAGKPIVLGNDAQILYGTLLKGGKVDSPFPEAQKIAAAALSPAKNQICEPQPFFIEVKSPKSDEALKNLVARLLPKRLEAEYKDKNGITSTNTIYSDLIEKLLTGNQQGIATDLRKDLDAAFNQGHFQDKAGQTVDTSALKKLYQIQTPLAPSLQSQLNQHRDKALGLSLARKIYAEGQEVEWQSIALSLGMGVVGEPTINHLFKDGGPVASAVRTSLMSSIDIMGNVLSVMGMVSEKQKEKGQKLSLETIFGPKEKRSLKHIFNPQGDAGPDIKQGVKAGFLGGLVGVLYNVPAGGILSMPNADVLSRSVIGGIGAAGSAVAIPTVVKSAQTGFEENIRKLIETDKLLLPKGIQKGSKEADKFIRNLALKEMNTRIGYASSIKATNPLPLVGVGTALLGAEKLGIPREYVQTAYMSLAPVMHNFLRLVYTGVEKWVTIPNRMKKLEKFAFGDNQKAADPNDLDKALLNGTWMTKALTSSGTVLSAGALLLAAEVLYFAHTYKQSKSSDIMPNQTAQPESPPANPINLQLSPKVNTGLTHHPTEFGDSNPVSQRPFAMPGYYTAPPQPIGFPIPAYLPYLAPYQPANNPFSQPIPWNNSPFTQQG